MLSPAEETFCQAFVRNEDASGAYRQAFLVPMALHYDTVFREARHLLDQPSVQDRIGEIRGELADAVPEGDGPGKGDRGLWCAVILRAIEDARGEGLQGPPRNRARLRDEAWAWLTQSSRDFYLVCELAGLEPRAVMAYARAVLMVA